MNYHDIKTDNMENGDGLRVVVWLSGCSHECQGCQNPETWDCNSGIQFDKEQKKFIFDELSKDYISGITFTGGDPLHPNNRNQVYMLCMEIKQKFPDKTIWIYTGYDISMLYALDILNDSFISYIDVLVDGIFIESLKDTSLMWRGSSNQFVIDLNKQPTLRGIGLHVFESYIPLEPQVEKTIAEKMRMHINYSK